MKCKVLCANPKGSKYHYSRYFGPQSIYYTITWTLWEHWSGSKRDNVSTHSGSFCSLAALDIV